MKGGMRIAIHLLVVSMMLLTLGQGQSIQEIDAFKKELKEPYRSVVQYMVLGLRGLRMGYFSKYRHGKFDSEVMKRDEKCFG